MTRKQYTAPTRYSAAELEAANLADLETDLRCAIRDGHEDYAQELRTQIEKLTIKARADSAQERYGTFATPDAPHVQRFREAYTTALHEAVAQHPEDYDYGTKGVPLVVEKIIRAWLDGTANHEGYAHRKACKLLGIPHTRRALVAFFAQKEE